MKVFRRLLVVLAVIWILDISGQFWGRDFKGVVLDAETDKPIEGAVAIIVWWKKPLVTMNGPEYVHRVKEVLTDSDGRFSIDASPGLDWNPFTYVLGNPVVAIYYPSYTPFPRAHLSIGIEETIAAMLKEGAVVKLPRLKTREELIDFAELGSIHLGGVPYHKIPNLVRLANIQRRMVGFEPFPTR